MVCVALLEGRCSIQLSYGRLTDFRTFGRRFIRLFVPEPYTHLSIEKLLPWLKLAT